MSRVYATCDLLSFAEVDDFRPTERAGSMYFLSHWPGTAAVVVVKKGEGE